MKDRNLIQLTKKKTNVINYTFPDEEAKEKIQNMVANIRHKTRLKNHEIIEKSVELFLNSL